MTVLLLIISHCLFQSFSWENLHVEGLSGADGRGQRVCRDNLDVYGVVPDFSWIFCHQVAQQLPVSCPAGVVPVVPLGPADCNKKKTADRKLWSYAAPIRTDACRYVQWRWASVCICTRTSTAERGVAAEANFIIIAHPRGLVRVFADEANGWVTSEKTKKCKSDEIK